MARPAARRFNAGGGPRDLAVLRHRRRFDRRHEQLRRGACAKNTKLGTIDRTLCISRHWRPSKTGGLVAKKQFQRRAEQMPHRTDFRSLRGNQQRHRQPQKQKSPAPNGIRENHGQKTSDGGSPMDDAPFKSGVVPAGLHPSSGSRPTQLSMFTASASAKPIDPAIPTRRGHAANNTTPDPNRPRSRHPYRSRPPARHTARKASQIAARPDRSQAHARRWKSSMRAEWPQQTRKLYTGRAAEGPGGKSGR